MPLVPHEHLVYGPIRSRRLGRSLGVNLLPTGLKVCNMNCAYCAYGWTRGERRTAQRATGWPAPGRIEAALASRLKRAAADEELIDRITVAGHGEPTLHPEFEEVVDRLRAVRDRVAPGIRTAILSNSTTAGWPDVQRALGRLDERYMKLDAGDAITYARINGPGPGIDSLIDALTEIGGVAVQAMFVTDGAGRVDNTTDHAVADWLRAIARVKPTHVHIYTIDRQPAAEYLQPAPRRRLREIAELVRAEGFQADVFPAGAV